MLPPVRLRVVSVRPLTSADLSPARLRPEWLVPPPSLSDNITSLNSQTMERMVGHREVLVVLDEADETP